ncbi:MAG: phosphotransferase family protein [Pseudomonadales bacterium]|jgi:aminoglycoside phosphotransferase (APT) family kinase protein|nr:phosphotransferase family protein [Gammaproteobacteria bacterium]MBP6053794.1 phosphotransferase family protein [Pseudomonadales bacterium]MBK6583910.1 phosphotransferase family protein [Gammaproteobacteria bacterium]MBK7169810.1 phosphotransferase family protein [Gammaproteobacteria bacterium]MBK7522246.1 phosphotransferase family protein [Gammaproteobacteria bacterium]
MGSGENEKTETAKQSELAPEWRRAFAFIEKSVGGRIVRHHRYPRWRPAFDVDVERDGEIIPVHFRGERPQVGIYPIEHECRAFQVCEKEGVLVPHVYAYCDDPAGIVMERSPGRPNLGTAESELERTAVLDEFLQNLVRMHAIDPAVLEAEGFERPTRSDALAWGDFPRWQADYERSKSGPDPTIAFTIEWLKRNQPRREEISFVQGDAGQFIFDKGHLTAVLDLELAHLGDPASDLGALFVRDLSEPLGPLPHAVRRYAELSGREMDPHVVNWHAVRVGICVPMSTASTLYKPNPDEPVQYIAWYHVYARMAIEVMALEVGVELEEPPVPEPVSGRQAPAFGALEKLLCVAKGADNYADYQVATAARVAEYLRRSECYGPALESDDLDEATALLGSRPPDWRAADAALEHFVSEAPAEQEGEILQYLYRRHQRQLLILQPILKEFQGSRVQKLR